MITQRVKIPQDRIGVLIGPKGFVKEHIERRSESTITIDSTEGDVLIEGREGGDPIKTLRVIEVVTAIGRGFSPENASKLLDDESLLLDVISLAHLSAKTLNRVKGRVIGRDGKTRQTIETLTGVLISVHGKTISLIGDQQRLRTAREAIEMLIRGAPHSSVYHFLERKRQAEEELEVW
jgi:ribosomal RNA assembly protein